MSQNHPRGIQIAQVLGEVFFLQRTQKATGMEKPWVWAFVSFGLPYSQSRDKYVICLNQLIYSCSEDELQDFLSFLGCLGLYLL